MVNDFVKFFGNYQVWSQITLRLLKTFRDILPRPGTVYRLLRL